MPVTGDTIDWVGLAAFIADMGWTGGEAALAERAYCA